MMDRNATIGLQERNHASQKLAGTPGVRVARHELMPGHALPTNRRLRLTTNETLP
jgi:hypothetical protein